MAKHILIGNFGNHSLAVMQALIERDLPELHFVYVETGWAAACWQDRVAACSEYARHQGVTVHQLKSQATFSEIVRDRRQFPSPKFQWCASFLKGLAILNFLDNHDPFCEALIISGKRQLDSRRYADLQEFDYDDEYYQGRTLWYPLWQTDNEEFLTLVKSTGFQFLPHQSLECSPCIHTKERELRQLDTCAMTKLEALEKEIDQPMYSVPVQHYSDPSGFNTALDEEQTPGLQNFDRGCGAPWGCGE